MQKRFNTTGVCISEKHYMVDISEKLKQIIKMVDREEYFVINRPRQYGKTTIMYNLFKNYRQKYLILKISFEVLSDADFKTEQDFCQALLDIMGQKMILEDERLGKYIIERSDKVSKLRQVSKIITKISKEADKPIVLMVDEVDKSSDNQLFLNFLGMLRNKYLERSEGLDYTFQSVILAGVYDIKNLKIKLRPDDERKYNSPWNIAVNFNIDMSFNSKEIQTILKQYSEETGIYIDIEKMAKKLYYYTSGYPFLVSRLCQIIDEDIKTEEKWTEDGLQKAVKAILKEHNTLFDDLIKNMENNKELYEFIYDIIINGEEKAYNAHDPMINFSEMLGIIKEKDNKAVVNNKIYEQILYNYMTSKKENTYDMSQYNFKNNFIKEDESLDFEKILLKYQQFMKEQYNQRDEKFIEREGRLLFLAFIKPIINGKGFDFKEVQISQEKRLDVVVTYGKYKYVSELKIWYGEKYHQKGLEQLRDYLDIQGLDRGYLVIYDFNKNKQYKQDKITMGGKEIFMVWV